MAGKQGRREAYIARVSRGEGFMPWQKKERTSPEKRAFRGSMERRKDEMLARRVRVIEWDYRSPEVVRCTACGAFCASGGAVA